jgi:hypothetical protein
MERLVGSAVTNTPMRDLDAVAAELEAVPRAANPPVT